MKVLGAILFVIELTLVVHGQSRSIEKQRLLDSLNLIIRNPKSHDTSLASTYVALSNILYVSDLDTMIPLCEIALGIAQDALANDPAKIIKKSILISLAAALNNIGYVYDTQGYKSKGLEYYRRSLEIQEEIGDKKGISISLNNIGYAYSTQGDIPKGLEYYQRSLKIQEEIGDKEGIARSLKNIGYTHHTQGNISEGLLYYHRNHQILNEMGDKEGIADILNTIGAAYDDNGDTLLALDFYQQSLQIREEIGDKKGIAASLNNIGFFYEKLGYVLKSLEYYQKSIEINKQVDDKKGLAVMYNNIGLIYNDLGSIEKAVKYYQMSLKLSEQISDIKMVSVSLCSIGLLHNGQGNNNIALEYHNKSLKLRQQIDDKKLISTCLNNIGYSYALSKKYSLALEYFNKSLRINENIGNKVGMSLDYNNIGSLYRKQKKYRLAIDYFMKSLGIKKGMQYKKKRVLTLINIGLAYFDMGLLADSKTYAKKALKLGKELGYPFRIEAASELLYKIFSRTNDFKKALEMYELHIQMRDSINNEETQKVAIKQNMKYEYEKQHLSDSLETSKELALKDIEIEKQEAEAKAERTTKYGLYGGLALVLVIALVLARSVKQKKRANEEILAQKLEVEKSKLHIEELHKEVTDSIHYAAHIQNAILTSDTYWQRMLPNHFVFFKPRDIVSGDFYWAYETPTKKKIWIAADCTGHGVPGGFMSMLGNTFLNEIIIEQQIEGADKILDSLRDHIIKALASDVGTDEGLEMKDGMDIALCILHPDMTLEYSGANNPLWILSDRSEVSANAKITPNETSKMFLHEIKAAKQPIGKYTQMTPFTSHKIKLETGDQVCTFSDGFPDQFGGDKLKKYMSKKLKKFLLSISHKPMEEQKELLMQEFENWRKDTEQVDDVCVIGVRI